MLTTDAQKIKKRSVYYSQENRLVDAQDAAAEPSSIVQAADAALEIKAKDSMTQDAAMEMMAQLTPSPEETLVIKVSMAVTMSLPQIPSERMHHAVFTKHLFLAGEISAADYVQKMRNLFPEQMEALAPDLRASVAKLLGEAN